MSELGRFPVEVVIRVMWGDMDALGHVNNAIYARWLEQARISYFERVGLLGQGSVGPILARQSIDFRRPVTYPDEVRVEVTVAAFGTSSFTLCYRGHSRAQGGPPAFEGESVIVVFDYAAGMKTPLSDEMRRRISELEESAPG